MNFTDFVLCIVRKIPEGNVTTYGEIAKARGGKKFARAVGNALNRNPYIVKIPCHRVVRSDGSIGGYRNGIKEKIRLLEKEGIKIKGNKILDFEKVIFKPINFNLCLSHIPVLQIQPLIVYKLLKNSANLNPPCQMVCKS